MKAQIKILLVQELELWSMGIDIGDVRFSEDGPFLPSAWSGFALLKTQFTEWFVYCKLSSHEKCD
jgi:hypothetical protein